MIFIYPTKVLNVLTWISTLISELQKNYTFQVKAYCLMLEFLV